VFENSHLIRIAKWYTSGAIVIGAFEVIDGVMHALNLWADWRLGLSVIEVCWFPVSLFLALAFKRLTLPIRLPLAFVTYMAVSFMVASGVVSSDQAGAALMPAWYGWVAMLFGGGYAVFASSVYRRYLIS